MIICFLPIILHRSTKLSKGEETNFSGLVLVFIIHHRHSNMAMEIMSTGKAELVDSLEFYFNTFQPIHLCSSIFCYYVHQTYTLSSCIHLLSLQKGVLNQLKVFKGINFILFILVSNKSILDYIKFTWY